MFKHHNYISISIGLIYMIILQALSNPVPVFRFLLPAVLLFSLAVSYYNYRYLQEIQKYNFWIVLRQVLLHLSAFGIFLMIPTPGIRGLFLITAVIFICLFEFSLGNYAENLLINETVLIAFGAYVSILGAGLYISPFFKSYLTFVYVLAIFAVTLLLTRSFYEFVPHTPRIKLFNSLAVALFSTEVFWALTFLPFHFSALAVLLLNVYYFCLILDYYYLYQTLSLKKIQFHLALISLCTVLVLLLTPWNIIS